MPNFAPKLFIVLHLLYDHSNSLPLCTTCIWSVVFIKYYINLCLFLVHLENPDILIFHVFLPFANLPRVPGSLAHVHTLGETPFPPFSYEWRQICVGQIVAEESCYTQVLLHSNERFKRKCETLWREKCANCTPLSPTGAPWHKKLWIILRLCKVSDISYYVICLLPVSED